MEDKKMSVDEWIKRWEKECEKRGLPKPIPGNKLGSFIFIGPKRNNRDNCKGDNINE